jgi:hypothetical protein
LSTTNSQYIEDVIQAATQEEEWDQFGGYADSLAECLELGDNFVVNVEEGVEFYVVLSTTSTNFEGRFTTRRCGPSSPCISLGF